MIFSKLLHGILYYKNYIFPKNCLNCGVEGFWICESCKDSLFFINNVFCPFCKVPYKKFATCPKCRKNINIIEVFSLFNYSDYFIQKIIKAFKYRYLKDITEDLEVIFKKFLFKYKSFFNKDAVIIPVPLHYYRERERGFNQAKEMAILIGDILKLKVDNNILIKFKKSKNQADISYVSRFGNLNGVFKVIKKPPENIILIDDVFTTGETVKEIANVLSLAGTKNIQVITLARG